MKCHFVPQSYLKRFCNLNGKLECFDLNKQFDPTRPKAVRSTAQIENWYVLLGLGEIPGYEAFGEERIEQDYQRLFENDLSSALDRLESCNLSPSDKDALARFVAFQLHRIPVTRKYYRQMQKGNKAVSEMSRRERLVRNAEIMWGHISTAVSGFSLAKFLLNSQWVLIRSEGGVAFVTSDNPVNCSNHPPSMSKLEELIGNYPMNPVELSARKTAYFITVSPYNVLYINTSIPASESDVELITGSWNAHKVQQYNDLIFRTCLSCIYSNSNDIVMNYCRRFGAGEISNDLFTDDPWNETI